MVDVKSGLMKLVDVGTSDDGVMVVVWVLVVWIVVVEVGNGTDEATGDTVAVVVAVTRDTPLGGETPLIQLVVPEWTSKMKGVVLEEDTGGSE